MSGTFVRVSMNNGTTTLDLDTEAEATRFVAAYGERNLVAWIRANDGEPEQETALDLLAEAASYLPAGTVLTLP